MGKAAAPLAGMCMCRHSRVCREQDGPAPTEGAEHPGALQPQPPTSNTSRGPGWQKTAWGVGGGASAWGAREAKHELALLLTRS